MRFGLILVMLFASEAFAGPSLEDAVAAGDVGALREHAAALASAEGAKSQLYSAYASWRLATLEEGATASTALKACNESAAKVPANDGYYGLSLAVKATCLGMLANANPAQAMLFGSQSASAMDEALSVAPDDPHVLFIAGMVDYHTPLQWGGDLDRSVRRLRRVIDTAEPLDAWVRPEAHAYLAMALSKLGECDQAADAVEAGMALSPVVGVLKGPATRAAEQCSPR